MMTVDFCHFPTAIWMAFMRHIHHAWATVIKPGCIAARLAHSFELSGVPF